MPSDSLILSAQNVAQFQRIVLEYYYEHGRPFAWRDTDDPYEIVVSEIMLQQTQTDRVVEKYAHFLGQFPTLSSLAHAPQDAVIVAWQGLGYNRRALALKAFAERVVAEFDGKVPSDEESLISFSGIGPNTVGSIQAFAFNTPSVFIETNIRSVYIDYFYKHQEVVHDKELMPLIAQTVDNSNPRRWYYALMDYGVMLKKSGRNPSRKSAHYTRQSKFEGSNRQVRGQILKALVAQKKVQHTQFHGMIKRDSSLIDTILKDLVAEGFISYSRGWYTLA